jgi:peptidyl-prolyl cis-trans isomerase C
MIRRFGAMAVLTALAAVSLRAADDPPKGPIPATPGARADALNVDALLAFIPEKVAASKDGFAITGEQLKELLRPQLELMIDNGQDIDEGKARAFAARLANSMLDHHLMAKAAERQGFKPDLDKARKQIDVYKQQMGTAAFRKRVELQGTTMDDIVLREAQSAAIRQWMHDTIEHDIKITDEEVRAYYDENRERFRKPERFQASHILVKVDAGADEETRKAARAKAERLLAELKDGADFAKLAKQYSDCPSKTRGGNLGTFRKGRMVPAFQEALEKLDADQISGIVETQFGYHIIKRGKGTPAEQVPFEEVKDRLKRQLSSQKQSEKLYEATRKLREEFDAVVLLNAE